MTVPLTVQFVAAPDSLPPGTKTEETIVVVRVPCRDETVEWKERSWFVADVITDLDGDSLTVVLRSYDQT
jgi:hypothetical protein